MTWTPPEPAVMETLYTLDQLLAVRRETIEECAKVCETLADIYSATVCIDCAKDIRKLGEQT